MANNEDNDSGTGENSKIDLLSEIQKLRAEKDEILKQIELKIDAQTEKLTEHGQNFEELSERLQSIEKLVEKSSKIDEDVETEENSKQADKTMQKSEKRIVFKHVFKNVENFVEKRYNQSDIENHFNADYFICLKRLDGHLAFFVHIHNPKKETGWSVETELYFKIYGPNQISKVQNYNHCFEKNEGCGSSKFLEWEEMRNEYLIDEGLTVEAHVEIIETSGLGREKLRKFDESEKDVSDLVVSVRNTKFYVARMFLAAQSSFFKALLLGNFAESKKSEIALTGIDPTDFHYLLEILYGEWAMDESTVEGVALLADMYDVPTARILRKSVLKKLKLPPTYALFFQLT
ncbi:unnamed protein product [Caenorhabditis nigoni]